MSSTRITAQESSGKLRNDLMFSRAIEFDLYADREFARRGGTDKLMGRDFSSNLLSKNQFLFAHPLLFRACLNAFDRIFWPALYLCHFLIFLRTIRGKKRAGSFSGTLPATVILDAAGRQHARICLNAGFDRDNTPRTVIYMRESYRRFPASIGASESYLRFVDRTDIIRAWREANRQTRIARRLLGTSCSVHLVKAIPWFLAKTMLEKIAAPDRTFCYCNNVDRWFYLFQSFRSVRQENVQHGVMLNLTRDRADAFVPRHDFARIDLLHVFDPAQEAVFRRLYPDIRSVVYFSPRIVLTPLPDSCRPAVLLVGHVLMFYDLEEQILRLAQRFGDNLTVYLKPHPAYSQAKYKKLLRVLSHGKASGTVPFRIVSDTEFFPAVDLVVSYNSSLVREYGAFGTDCVVYDDRSLAGSLDGIEQKLEQLSTTAKERP